MEIPLTDNLHLHIHERPGSGATVVFIHGWAVNGLLWSSIFERWTGPERLLAVDLRGTGWSSKPRAGYTLAQFSDDVIALIHHLDTPVTLVGHSMGGAIAQWVASAVPERISTLILVSPVPAQGVPMPDADADALRSLGGHRALIRAMFESMVSTVVPAGLDRLTALNATVAVECYTESLDAFRTADFAERLPMITAPVHVIGGADEQILSPTVLEAAVVSRFDGATFETIPHCGHYPHIETPDELTALLEKRLR